MPGRHLIAVRTWLVTGCILIAALVTVGGVTRLTGSGLSITEWDVLMGALPPLSQAEWDLLFAKYRATPQFQLVNPSFTLADFKNIFWWEYLHRLLARGLGVVFLLPCLYFLARGYLDAALRRRVLLIFGLGAMQGILGWLMVASGLVDRPAVSHYRLAAHLLTALVTFSVTLWVALGLGRDGAPGTGRNLPIGAGPALTGFTVLLGLQITYGAFVAGLRAGGMYNTFPLMGDTWVPSGLLLLEPAVRNLAENPVTVQFIHRLLAWAVLLAGWIIGARVYRAGLRRAGALLVAAVSLQFALGVLTILRFPASPVFWGAAHQAGAVILLAATVSALHTAARRARGTVAEPAVALAPAG